MHSVFFRPLRSANVLGAPMGAHAQPGLNPLRFQETPMTRVQKSLCLLGLISWMAGVVACGGSDHLDGDDRFGPGTVLGSFRLGPAGGQIALDGGHTQDPALQGLLLQVPPGLIRSETVFTIAQIDPAPSLSENAEAVGPTLRITAKPPLPRGDVTVWLPYERQRIHYTDAFFVAHNAASQPLENPMQRVVLSQRPAVPVAVQELGLFQLLVRRPDPAVIMSLRDNIRAIDVLFVIDNSPSMADKQGLLTSKIGVFADKLIESFKKIKEYHKSKGRSQELSIHVGIISTNVGIGYDADPRISQLRDCTKLGDDGNFQEKSCTMRPNTASDPRCTTYCNKEYIANDMKPFIRIESNSAGTVSSNISLPAGSSNDINAISSAFSTMMSCRAYLGERGCGREAPFEAVRRAIGKGKDFFRYNRTPAMDPDRNSNTSLLFLVLISDEDDQSLADPSKAAMLYDYNTSPGTPGGAKQPTNFHLNFRGFAMSTICKEDFFSAGMKTDCKEDAMQTFLYPVLGPKGANPSVVNDMIGADHKYNVLMAAIVPPGPIKFYDDSATTMKVWGDLYGKKMINPATVDLELDPAQTTCAATDLDCLVEKRHTCTTPGAMTYSAQHRLSKFASFGAPMGETLGPRQSIQADICEKKEYEQILALLPQSLGL